MCVDNSDARSGRSLTEASDFFIIECQRVKFLRARFRVRHNVEDGCEHAKSFSLRTSRFLIISSTGKLQFPRPPSTLWSSRSTLCRHNVEDGCELQSESLL